MLNYGGKDEREIPEGTRDELMMLYALMLSGATPMYLDMRDEILRRLKALNDEVMDVYANIRCDVIVCKKHEWYCLVSNDVDFRIKQFLDFCKWLMNGKKNGE